MDTRINKFSIIPFYFFILLLITVPLAMSKYFENPVDLVKMSTFIIMSSFFIMFSIVISAEENLKYGNKFSFNINKSFDLPVLIFIIAAILSTIFSINPKVSVFGQYQREIGLITFIYLSVIYFLASGIFSDKKRFNTISLLVEIIAVAVSLYAIIQLAGFDPFGIQQPGLDRPVSSFGNAVFLGGFLVLIFPFSALNISSKRNKAAKIIFPLIIITGIIISGTRSAYLALGAEIAVILLFYFLVNRNKKTPVEADKNSKINIKNILIVIAGTLIILILYIIIFPDSFLSGRFLSLFGDLSNNPRLVLWRDSFNLFFKYPLFGTGIAMFSPAFEEFYSNRLRLLDRTGYFDHPHNNYLYMLYSMGIVGFLSYSGILIQSIRRCIININKNDDIEVKILFTAFLAFLGGYCVYGFTNFDDISILLYFFVFLAALRSIDKEKTKELVLNPKIISAIVIPLILICSYNIYNSINDLKADRFFKQGNNSVKQGKFAEALFNMNTAIALNDYFTDYKYVLAYTVYRQCFSNETMSKESKMNLLNQAVQQIEGLKNSHYFTNESKGLLSLVYYEMNRDTEAKLLENEVLAKDSVNISYRINLAKYYMKQNDLKKAGELMDVVLELRPKSLEAYLTAAYLNYKKGNIELSKKFCEEILINEPGNQFAIKLLSEIETGKKQLP